METKSNGIAEEEISKIEEGARATYTNTVSKSTSCDINGFCSSNLVVTITQKVSLTTQNFDQQIVSVHVKI